MDLALGMVTRFPGLNVQVAGKMLGFTNLNMLLLIRFFFFRVYCYSLRPGLLGPSTKTQVPRLLVVTVRDFLGVQLPTSVGQLSTRDSLREPSCCMQRIGLGLCRRINRVFITQHWLLDKSLHAASFSRMQQRFSQWESIFLN